MADKRPITILLVDDVEASRYTLSRMLQRAHYLVKEAGTGIEALRLAAEKPDLVILDVNLPDMSGYEVCKQIKAAPTTSSIPVLHLSASFVESENRAEGLESGADGYLTYPVETRELLATIQALLRARRAEQQERANRELLHVTLGSIGDGVIATNPQSLVTFLNPVAQTLTGWTQEEAAGRPLSEVFQIVDAQTRQPAESPPARVLREGAVAGVPHPTLLIARDGSQKLIDESAAPIRDRDGRVAGVVLVFRDVTERQRAEEARRQTEERLRLMVESVQDYAIFTTDPQGLVTTWNSGAERVFGHREADILGQPTAILFLPEDVTAGVPQRELAKAAEEGRGEDERWHLRKDGSRFFASGIVTPLRDAAGTLLGFTKVSRDVTERKRAEQEIARLLAAERRQARRLRRVAATSLTVNAALTRESVLGVITEEARKIIEAHQARSTLVVNEQWAQALHCVSLSDKYAMERGQDEKPDGSGLVAHVCRSNQPVRLTQAELAAHPASQGLAMEADRRPPLRGWLAAPFVARNGRNLGLLSLSDKGEGEFTEEDEAILVQLALIASVAIENAHLYQELREADRRKDEFLAILAHELRNPLAPLRNALQIMHVARNDAGAVATARNVMDRQVQQMVRLIDDLLDLSRISRGRIELRKAPVELAAVVNHALEASRPFIEACGHELTVTLPPGPVLLLADMPRLSQVLMNLLNNAAKYTERGGRIALGAERVGNQVVIRVKDTGIGIPAHMLGRIFEMFAQVDQSLERAQGGLGIGLTLVRTLVTMHGGSVEARSEGPGQGSEFIVRLPLAAAGQPTAATEKPDAGGKGRPTLLKQRILVVDDNRDAAESLGMLLRILGNDVRTAHDGLAAVDAAAAFQPHVVLLDIGLPGLNGYEVAEQIRRQRPQGEVMLVAVTGWGQEKDRRRSQEAGFDYHVVKPVDLNSLRTLLGSFPSSL